MLRINPVKRVADALQDAPRADRRQETVVKPVLQRHDQFDAVRLDQQASAMKGINVQLRAAGLKPAQEMAGQDDDGHGQAQPPGQQQIEQTQADGVASFVVQHHVEVAVVRIVETFLVPGEPQLAKKIIVDHADDLIRRPVQVQALAQFVGVFVQQGRVGFQVDAWILGAAQQQRAALQVKVLALVEAEGQKLVVRVLPRKMIHDFRGAAAQNRIAAQGVLAHPLGTGRAVGKDGLTNRAIHFGVLVRQEAD